MQITCEKAVWDESRHAGLVRDCETYEGADYIRLHIVSGDVLLYEVVKADQLLGIFLARVDRMMNNADELVIIGVRSVSGQDPGFAAIGTECAKEIARMNNLTSIRIHSTNKAVARILGRIGWQEIERIHRIRL